MDCLYYYCIVTTLPIENLVVCTHQERGFQVAMALNCHFSGFRSQIPKHMSDSAPAPPPPPRQVCSQGAASYSNGISASNHEGQGIIVVR